MSEQKSSKSKTLTVAAEPMARDKMLAELAVSGGVNAAAIITNYSKGNFGELSLDECIGALGRKARKIHGGDLTEVETVLISQAMALDTVFAYMTRASQGCDMLNQTETFMRLGLKAQAQCRATLEALAAIKNPPVVYAKQANIAQGPQQVNNGIASSRRREDKIEQSELLEESHEPRMDIGAAEKASGSDPALEALEPFNRAKDK